MKKFAVVLLGLLLLVGLMASMCSAHRLLNNPTKGKVYDPDNSMYSTGEYTPAAALDTMWFGFVTGGTMSKVGLGGKWDFDTDSTGAQITGVGVGTVSGGQWHASAAGIRAMQGWTPSLSQVQCEAFDPDACRQEPDTYMNYGNRGRFWHQQDMTSIPKIDGVTPNINLTNLDGSPSSGSLWCGLDRATAASTLMEFEAGLGITCAVNFPGYGDYWDQLVAKDVSVPGAGGTQMTFKYAVDLDTKTEEGAPTVGASIMQNGSLFDVFDVYVGNPVNATIDANNDLTELVGGSPVHLLGPLNGLSDSTGTLNTTPFFGNGVLGIGQTARVVFRVRTNTTRSDESGTVSYDGVIQQNGSNFGAALIDDVYFSNGARGMTNGVLDGVGSDGNGSASAYRFESAGNMQGFVACAKALPLWAHAFNVGNNDLTGTGLSFDPSSPDLQWADPCGLPGASTSLCNLVNNTLATFDPYPLGSARDHYSAVNWPISGGVVRGETCQGAYSPDIDLTSDGINPIGRAGGVAQYDVYAYNPLEEGVLYQTFVRYKTNPAQACPGYQSWRWRNTQFYTPSPTCSVVNFTASAIVPVSSTTHLQFLLAPDTFCWETPPPPTASGDCTANFTPLFDNCRFGLVNTISAPGIAIDPWELFQDAYPGDDYPSKLVPGAAGRPANTYLAMQKRFVGGTHYNANFYNKSLSVDGTAGTVGGLNLNIDGQTAVIVGAKMSSSGPGVKPNDGCYREDSTQIRAAFSSKGTRMDCIFRVIPGPLTDTTDTWFSAFKANTGVFGSGGNNNPAAPTGGTHGAGSPTDHWRWYVWNDAQMDTAESDRYDTTANTASIARSSSAWSTTYHEGDPHYNTVGVTTNHELPLVFPASPFAWISPNSGHFTNEHSPIFPSYLFTPGTQIDYFFRSCFLTTPTVFATLPDTTVVQTVGGNSFHLRVLPNAWNDFARYGANRWTGEVGKGRACVLFVDHSNGNPDHFPYRFAMDSLGIITDEYTVQAPSSSIGSVGDGAMDIQAPPAGGGAWLNYGSTGPTRAQLSGYNDIFYTAGVLNSSAISDADDQDPSEDTQLFSSWLSTNPVGVNRLLWLNGTGINQYLDLRRPAGSPGDAFRAQLGILDQSVDDGSTTANYRVITHDQTECPTIVPNTNVGNVWNANNINVGVIFNYCVLAYDMVAPNTGIGAYNSQLYPVASPVTGTRGSGVVVDQTSGSGGRSVSLSDALNFSRVRDVNCHGDYGRIAQMRTVYYKLGATGSTPFCQHTFAQTAVNPGTGREFVTALFQNSPNPFRPNRATSIHYSVGRTAPVYLNIHDVSGRLVRTLVNSTKVAGDYTATFDGRDADGRSLAAGVYFYRLKVGDFESNRKMLMLK